MTPAGGACRVFVTVGTHEQAFPRLLTAVAGIATDWQDSERSAVWRVQAGPARIDFPPSVDQFAACTHEEILAHMRWADIAVCQCSPGLVFAAISQGAQPVVVPRSSALGEHVDDHQHVFGQHLAGGSLALVSDDVSQLGDVLEGLAAEPRSLRCDRLARLEHESMYRTADWVQRVGMAVEELRDHGRAAPSYGGAAGGLFATSTKTLWSMLGPPSRSRRVRDLN